MHQIDPYKAYSYEDLFQLDNEDSMHYNPKIDRQIKIPIPNVEEYLYELKSKRRI